MKYTKQSLTISQQIEKLESRGLIIDNKNTAADYLSIISYYRLRAYTYPFQHNNDEEKDHHFIRDDINFQDIIDLYHFDSRLRFLVFNAIEKIEIAIRTKIIYEYAIQTKDSHWYTDESLFNDKSYFETNGAGKKEEIFFYDKLSDDICYEIKRSNEDFIKHYQTHYSSPDLPPAWMTLEVLSLGVLSRLYELLKKTETKKAIAKWFGLMDISIMENWLHSISVLRNFCAHHSRIWNRRFSVEIKLPYNTVYPFMDRDTIKTIHKNKIFSHLSCIKYLLDIIYPNNNFKEDFMEICNNGGKLYRIKDMGFPDNWRYIGVWKDRL
jgi:abortive infection bacteriophage resistance protein